MTTLLSHTSEHLAETVARRIRDQAIKTVIVGGCDLNGVFRGKFLPAARFAQAPGTPIPFCEVIYIFDLADGLVPAPPGAGDWWPRVERGVGDLLAVPDLSTFRRVPWLKDTALVLCDHERLDGTPLEVSPRGVLRRCAAEAEVRGFVPKMAAELEFFLFENIDGPDGGLPSAGGSLGASSTAYRVARDSREDDVLGSICRHVSEFGLEVECTSAEAGAGQYEVNLGYGELPLAADRAFLHKHAVKELAARHGVVASFMAKPTAGFGSSCHLHQSIWSSDGRNLMAEPSAPHGLSAVGAAFIAGQLATLPELTCLYAPTINSYKRFAPMSAAPTTVTWGRENRTTALRLLGRPGGSLRVENRSPGADVNVYLGMAAALAGGLHGIEHQLALPEPVTGNAYADGTLEPLPRSLEDAVQRLEASEVARRFLGDRFVEFYAATRRFEIEQFRSQPTDWEIRRYLKLA